MTTKTIRAACAGLLLAVSAAQASAQDVARSFEQLQVLVQPGDTVTVRDAQGAEKKGRITSLTDAALTVAQGDGTRAFHEADVATIDQRRGDPLKNGALWGLGVGMGLAGLGIAGVCGDDLNG